MDGTANTLTLGGGINLTGSTLDLEVGNNGAVGTWDEISATGAATLAGVNTINISLISGQTIVPGTYNILSAASGLNTGGTFALGSNLPVGYGFSLSSPGPTLEQLTITGNVVPTTAYWTGAASQAGADTANNWGFGLPAASNWSTAADGTSDALQIPGSVTDVIFTAANAVGSGGTLSTQLDGAYGIKGLTVAVPAATGITATAINTSGYTLTIGVDGLTMAAANASSLTISGTGGVAVLVSQSWANNNSATSLTVGAPPVSAVSGATTLTLNGTASGGVVLSGPIGNGGGTLACI